VCIVANNCWGGEFYRYLSRPYTTPLVGISINGPCFARLVERLPEVLDRRLEFVQTSRYDGEPRPYPLGVLDGDIELHFVHGRDQVSAEADWRRRADRVTDPILVTLDCNGPAVDTDTIATVKASPYRTLLLAPAEAQLPGAVPVKNHTIDAARLFGETISEWDLLDWVADGATRIRRRRSPVRRLRRLAYRL
jgi:hypothetical protein